MQARNPGYVALASGLVLIATATLLEASSRTPEVNADNRPITSSDRALLAKALASYENGRVAEAEPMLRELFTRYPNRFEIAETLGLIQAERGDLTQAVPFLETACQADPSSAPASANLGAAYLRLNRIDDAVRVLKRAATLDPANSGTQSSLGQALMLAKRPAEAAEAFAAASAGDPKDADILYNWGLTVFEAGDATRAEGILARIPAQSLSAQAHSLLGDVEEQLGHFEAAFDHKRAAAEADPSEANLDALGIELLKHWNFDGAIRVYERGLSLYPASARMQKGLGIAKYGNNEISDSTQILSRLLAAHPDNPGYAALLGDFCYALREESDAEEGCGALLDYAQRHPEDAAAGTAAASVIVRTRQVGKFDIARQMLARAIAANPKDAESWFERGVLDLEQSDWRDSVEALRRAAELRPASSKTLWRLAQAYSHLGDKEQAHREVLLQQRFHQTEEAERDARQRSVQTFILDTH